MTAISALKSYQIDTAFRAPIAVACRRCKAQRGDHCTSRKRSGNHVPFHPERKADVEHLSHDDRVLAVQQLIMDRHAAATAPLPALTVEQQAVRDATSRAWDGILAAEGETRRGTLPVTNLAAVRAARHRPTSLDVA